MAQWFEFNEKETDLDNVLAFIHYLPIPLRQLANEESFINLLKNDETHGVYGNTYSLFFDAFEEAKNRLQIDLNELVTNLLENNPDYKIFMEKTDEILHQIGFTGNSLKLKASVLNKLWDEVIKAGKGIIDFASNPVAKALRKFLAYLNSMLGSLKALLPGIDAIKEIKDVMESYLNVVE